VVIPHLWLNWIGMDGDCGMRSLFTSISQIVPLL
jgi:hypothetical protein